MPVQRFYLNNVKLKRQKRLEWRSNTPWIDQNSQCWAKKNTNRSNCTKQYKWRRKKACYYAHQQPLCKWGEKINQLNEQHNTRQLYNRAKTQKTGFNKYSQLQIDPNALEKHFEAHFKSPANRPPIPETLSNPPKEITDELRKLSEDFPVDNHPKWTRGLKSYTKAEW